MDCGAPTAAGVAYQEGFHARWPDLRDPQVRALVWLLDAPDLMDIAAPCWNGRIASLGEMSGPTQAWVQQLQDDPRLNQALHAHMARQPTARLGRYAEKLLAFYLEQQRQLVGTNLQVRNQGGARETLGEFDFLVKRPSVDSGAGLEHWELATKFYLLEPAPSVAGDPGVPADAFLGPNLADSLGRKMRKIMQQQLMLSRHPAAAAVLPEAVSSAQALVKGWLFYPSDSCATPLVMGIAPNHCRGFWCDSRSLPSPSCSEPTLYLPLSRLEWLAPARGPIGQALSWPALLVTLERRFAQENVPVMVALCRPLSGAEVVEFDRGFIVPEGWRERAAEHARQAIVRI